MDKDASFFTSLTEVEESNIYVVDDLSSILLVKVMFLFHMGESPMSIMCQTLMPMCYMFLS
jgi:hypothetical protein